MRRASAAAARSAGPPCAVPLLATVEPSVVRERIRRPVSQIGILIAVTSTSSSSADDLPEARPRALAELHLRREHRTVLSALIASHESTWFGVRRPMFGGSRPPWPCPRPTPAPTSRTRRSARRRPSGTTSARAHALRAACRRAAVSPTCSPFVPSSPKAAACEKGAAVLGTGTPTPRSSLRRTGRTAEPRAGPGRRSPARVTSYIPAALSTPRTRAGVIGASRMRTPVASKNAFAIAAGPARSAARPTPAGARSVRCTTLASPSARP